MTAPPPDIHEIKDECYMLLAILGANVRTGLLAQAFRWVDLDAADTADILRSRQTDSQPGSAGIADTSTTEQAAIAGLTIRTTREDLIDAVESMRREMHAVRFLVNKVADKARLEPSAGKARCESKVTEADCHNFASDHRDDVGSTVNGMCDSCWTLACPTCHTRAAKGRFGGKCEPCYRKALRAVRADPTTVVA